ncbi:MAG: alpha/beta fold hydrolase [Rhodoluna sp.]
MLVADRFAKLARDRAVAREIQVMDTVTRYWEYPATNADSPTLILIHGYRGNHHGLEAIAGALPEFNIIIPDLPGFGKSTPFGNAHSIENYSWWLGEFIDRLGLPAKPHLLGHSFGSIVVSHHVAHSDDVSSLILENPVSAPALKGPNAVVTKIAQAFFHFAGRLPLEPGEKLLKSWPMVRGMSILMTKSLNRKMRSWVHAQHDANFNDFANRRVAIEGYQASISRNVGEFAPEFKVPVLVIAGTRDDITSLKQQKTMFDLIRVEKQLVVLPKVGHLTHYECPDLVAAAISAHIKKLESAI